MHRWLMLFLLMSAPGAIAAEDRREVVVLLHGVAMSGWTMQPLARAIEAAGYRPVNISYPSRTMPIEQIAREFLPAQLRAAEIERAPRIHFVTHSMGSLVTRIFLQAHRPANLGRVVMLGPPNHGSAAADRVRDNRAISWIMGRNLPALSATDGIARQLPAADFELGIIAGSSRINPLFDSDLGGGVHDGVVTLESARLAGMDDFIVVPHSHTIMLWRSAVIAQVLHFLREGKFQQPPPSET